MRVGAVEGQTGKLLRIRGLTLVLAGVLSAPVWASSAAEVVDRDAGQQTTGQKPAKGRESAAEHPAQRAKPKDSRIRWRWHTVARGLHHPWALAFLPDGRFLVTERRGTMRIVQPDGKLEAPLGGLPEVYAKLQGGLLDVALPDDFEQTRQVYFCFAEASPSGFNGTALAVGELSKDDRRLNRVKVLFRQQPKVGSQLHFGCRIVFQAGKIFLTLGERFSEMQQAQKLDNHLGKIVRINRDGSVPKDNPFVNRKGALPEIWSYGHRNAQGAALGPDGRLWIHEHGPQGGDEINVIEPGANYGWPVISYGEQYGGGPIGSGKSAMPGMKQPLYYWLPSMAPSGMTFVKGRTRCGQDWAGNLLVGALKFGYVARLTLSEDGRVLGEEMISVDERVRDVRESPDGNIYILTDSADGGLLRLRAP